MQETEQDACSRRLISMRMNLEIDSLGDVNGYHASKSEPMDEEAKIYTAM